MCFLCPNAISPNGWYLVMPFPPRESASKSFGMDTNHLGVPGSLTQVVCSASYTMDNGSGLDPEAEARNDAADLM